MAVLPAGAGGRRIAQRSVGVVGVRVPVESRAGAAVGSETTSTPLGRPSPRPTPRSPTVYRWGFFKVEPFLQRQGPDGDAGREVRGTVKYYRYRSAGSCIAVRRRDSANVAVAWRRGVVGCRRSAPRSGASAAESLAEVMVEDASWTPRWARLMTPPGARQAPRRPRWGRARRESPRAEMCVPTSFSPRGAGVAATRLPRAAGIASSTTVYTGLTSGWALVERRLEGAKLGQRPR